MICIINVKQIAHLSAGLVVRDTFSYKSIHFRTRKILKISDIYQDIVQLVDRVSTTEVYEYESVKNL